MSIESVAQGLFDWLVDGAPGVRTLPEVLARVGPELARAGVPLERMAAFVRTLHPAAMGRSFVWEPGEQVDARESPWELLATPTFLDSPVAKVFASGQSLRARLADEPGLGADLLALKARGFTDFVALPLRFMDGSVHAITFATRAPHGFAEAQLATLAHVVRALARVTDSLSARYTTINLLNAYVGNDAGERILRGQVQRGDTEVLRCVIWFSDLRGFTALSSQRSPQEVIAVLNEFFECQVPAIESEGGQVLKFIGDGLLAMFPVGARTPADAGEAALRASSASFHALASLNGRRVGRGETALAFGVALHQGDVAYGNIGGANRLDFTAIGPAVNLAARIEGMTSTLGRPVLLSAQLAAQVRTPTRSLGRVQLKGLVDAVELFEPS
jgi:adenylate cyclase